MPNTRCHNKLSIVYISWEWVCSGKQGLIAISVAFQHIHISFFFFFFFFFVSFSEIGISPGWFPLIGWTPLGYTFHANRSLVHWSLRMPIGMNILLVMTKREEPCIGSLKMLNQSKSLHCRWPEKPNLTVHKCLYNGRLIQKLWEEQPKKRSTLTKLSQRLHNVERTTYWRRCQVTTSCRRLYDVISTSCACLG